jgi:DnaK suppressor protein
VRKLALGPLHLPFAAEERNVSDKDLTTLRSELHKRRRRILETTRRAHAELEALRAAERDPEFEEGAQSEHEEYTLARLTEAQRRELAQIDAAFARMDGGEFGVCQECETEIDPRRLAVLPYALLCADCAQRAERSVVTAQETPRL